MHCAHYFRIYLASMLCSKDSVRLMSQAQPWSLLIRWCNSSSKMRLAEIKITVEGTNTCLALSSCQTKWSGQLSTWAKWLLQMSSEKVHSSLLIWKLWSSSSSSDGCLTVSLSRPRLTLSGHWLKKWKSFSHRYSNQVAINWSYRLSVTSSSVTQMKTTDH